MPPLMSLARAALIFALLCIAAACSMEASPVRRIDETWFRSSLQNDHMTRWLAVAPTGNGFFRTDFNRQWVAKEKQSGGVIGQTRALYVLSAGYEITQNPAYLQQVRAGADFLLTHFRDKEFGGWFEAVGADGAVLNPNKRLYAQVFAIFALAHAYRVTHDTRYLDAANATRVVIQDKFADGMGGFRAGMNREFTQTKLDNSQNPVMHLFEALLALYDAGGSPEILKDARKVGDFVVYKLLQGAADGSAFIPENYDSTWKPLGQEQGGLVDIGHQFEWAFMLGAATERGLPPLYADVADRLLKFGVEKGYDRVDSGVFTSAMANGEINRKKGYWQQAEALRALMYHAVARQRQDLAPLITQMSEFVRSEFVDETNGGWYLAPKSECRRHSCPDIQPDGYHMVALHREAIRLVEQYRR